MSLRKNILLILSLLLFEYVFLACGDMIDEDAEGADIDWQDNGEEEDDDLDDILEDGKEPTREKGVWILTDGNYKQFLVDNEVVIVEFYAPWCGHCQQFAPTYEEIAQTLDGEIAVAKVDATVEKTFASANSVSGYPTIFIFKNGEPQPYKGERSKEAVIKKARELADPSWKAPEPAVITLTKENFDETIQSSDLILVEFYAPWCGHCKKLAPEYEAAAQTLKKLDPPVALAKVDATVESDIASKYDVSGYPTMKMFRQGRLYEYEGGRTEDTIVSYMKEQNKPPAKELLSVKEMRKILKQTTEAVVIGCFLGGESDPLSKFFQVAGNKKRASFDFYQTFSAEIVENLGAKDGNIIVFQPEYLQSKYEPKRKVYDMKAKAEELDYNGENVDLALLTYLDDNLLPFVGHRTRANHKSHFGDKRPLVVVYYTVDFSFDHRKATQLVRNKIVTVARDFRDVHFAISHEEDFADELKVAGLDDSPEEVNVVLYEDERRYPMPPTEDFDHDVLFGFVRDYKAGLVKPKTKSQPKPKKNNAAVKVVVGDNFNEIVMDESKDVMIEFYAPWCGHCKRLAPVWKKLAKEFKDDRQIVIAKMDATANDVPYHHEFRYNHLHFKAEGYPTILWAPKNNKDMPEKVEKRTLEDLVEYVNEHRSSGGAKDEL